MEANKHHFPGIPDGNSIYEVPLEQAEDWVGGWSKQGNLVKGFLINVQELQEIIAQQGTCYVRVYFGWNSEGQPGDQEKMVLVPVDEKGCDVVPNVATKSSNVFDFTLPCPPTCDSTSPLYKASQLGAIIYKKESLAKES